MRRVVLIAGLAVAAPAQAGTLEEIITRGMVIVTPQVELDLTFSPDGTYEAPAAGLRGRWRIDGDKLCTTSNLDPHERCEVYPADKKSGDAWDVEAPEGRLQIRIK